MEYYWFAFLPMKTRLAIAKRHYRMIDHLPKDLLREKREECWKQWSAISSEYAAHKVGYYGMSDYVESFPYLTGIGRPQELVVGALEGGNTEFIIENNLRISTETLESWIPNCLAADFRRIMHLMDFNSRVACNLIESNMDDCDVIELLGYCTTTSSQMLETSVTRPTSIVTCFLLKRKKLNVVPALKEAISLSKKDRVDILLDAVKQDVAYIQVPFQDHVLDLAIEEGKTKIVRWLCSRGLAKNIWSGLATATRTGNDDAVSILLQHIT